jgi:hypothetical protein
MAAVNGANLKQNPAITLISLTWDRVNSHLNLSVGSWFIAGVVVCTIVWIALKWKMGGVSFKSIEIDQAELGVGSNKLRFRPNLTDRQVAYAIWVELSTRKIGLEIDFDHDVISEIYDSWYSFFGVTRELIKSVPVSKIKSDSTQAIIKLSIEVLNEGLRPHLTRWQSRFRHWYERALKRHDTQQAGKVIDPQQIQSEFPQFQELKQDMERVNRALIRYRQKMRELVLKD